MSEEITGNKEQNVSDNIPEDVVIDLAAENTDTADNEENANGRESDKGKKTKALKAGKEKEGRIFQVQLVRLWEDGCEGIIQSQENKENEGRS